ncbi:MAG: hypothetical protein ACK5PP_18910 [Acidimicrobiales bacterium]
MTGIRRRAAVLAGAAAVGAVATAGVLVWRRRPPMMASGPVLGRRMLVRNLRLARMAARGGGLYAVHRALRTFASAERRETLDTEFQLRCAADVTA